LVIAYCAVTLCSWSQCTPASFAGGDVFNQWLQCRVDALVQKNLKQSATEKQTEQPSASSASTSLLDRTSASDLVGVAVQLAGAGQHGDNQSGSTTVTASAYALITSVTGSNPLNPTIYDANRNWRRLSITLGSEAASAQNNQTKSKIFGAKVLFLDWRDVSSPRSKKLLRQASTTLANTNVIYAALSLQVRQYLYRTLGPRINPTSYPLSGDVVAHSTFANNELSDTRLAATVGLLNSQELSQIDDFISGGVLSSFVDEAQNVRRIVSSIRRAPQFSMSYAATIADQDVGNTKINHHRFEGIFDYGPNEWTNVTVNASFEYLDSKQIGKDLRGARIAAAGEFELNHVQAFAKGISPYTVAISSEAKFLSSSGNTYQAQAKLTVPLSKGISLPMSVTVANRTELIKESDVRGQFGFTVDVAKLAGMFTSTGK
jgi:hypothetical protein